MDYSMNEPVKRAISSSEDESLEAECYSNQDDTFEKKYQVNEDDDSSSSDDDNAGDKKLSEHHRETFDFRNLDWGDVPTFIHSMDQGPMSLYDRQKARETKEQILNIKSRLAQENCILRPLYKNNGFHLCKNNEYQQKVSDFMTKTSIYSLINKLIDPYTDASKKCLADVVDQVQTTLDNLLHSQRLTKQKHSRMSINRSSVRLNYLYFTVDTRSEECPIQPIVVCNDGPTIGIAGYVGHLLGLLFNEATDCKLFSKSIDVIQAVEYYSQSGHLQPTTLFASFNIDDLCTRFSHDHAVAALERSLHSYAFDHLIQGMTIDTIVQLVRLVLENQYCVLGKNLYRQRIGGGSGLPLTIPLTYIYLFYWQQDPMNVFINKNELFGRYQDEAFITWNESEDELHTVLTLAHSEFPQYIWNTTGIGSKICFRDIELGHNNGRVRTTVNYLDSYMRNNALPSFLDILQQRIGDVWTWLRASLLNAVRYCSDDVNFEDVKSQMKFILSLNGFSDDTFNDGLHEFLDQFGVSTVDPSLTRTNCEIMRQHVFDNDKYRKAMEKNGLLQRKEQVTLHLPYVSPSETLVITQFEQELNNLLSEHRSDHSQMKDLKIKILPYRSPSFPIVDLLVHKRPPIHRLTLPETDQINKSSYGARHISF
ncbi:unnamed protein product [Rotaria socialis]|uniref:Reverse transcriptase domain-containing protein n=1 Tax=Rotaria socialis TaxID=392032 RepID=A0A820H6E4_9BILA|nr:unnamed protein product [Rotaria socialis]CAF4288393.1 unnamed protein product [Rotaria socialis]